MIPYQLLNDTLIETLNSCLCTKHLFDLTPERKNRLDGDNCRAMAIGVHSLLGPQRGYRSNLTGRRDKEIGSLLEAVIMLGPHQLRRERVFELLLKRMYNSPRVVFQNYLT